MRFYSILFLTGMVACQHKPKELTMEEKHAALEKEYQDRQEALEQHVQFKINGIPFKASGLGHIAELKMDQSINKPVFRLYFVDNTYQALDMVFFEEPLRTQIPFTFSFKDNGVGDQKTTNWAVLSFSSGEIPGWHKVPKKDSYITITAWDQDHHTLSGEFQALIENAEDKNKTISITEGKFTQLSYSRKY